MPTPGRYGTSYGGAPSPGNPSKVRGQSVNDIDYFCDECNIQRWNLIKLGKVAC